MIFEQSFLRVLSKYQKKVLFDLHFTAYVTTCYSAFFHNIIQNPRLLYQPNMSNKPLTLKVS